ncbi:excalibur calcium-binding domain-containing protein [uncultured Arthrobacter sp.]|uniref:excalibur calcium-binding domain-containing protein n=1 Tax=uncultured Arthrobacter sp. TaxID=114050 RepID=UPI00262952E4|nr:excalibur calcium-binding domain-containing protein [uncultured Arthrobacter sp.]
MKKTSIALATSAAAGLALFSASPALAVGLPFENCTAAANVGVYNIPVGTPGYQPGLNSDDDATGCDAAGNPPYDASIVARIVAENEPMVPQDPPVTPMPQPQPEVQQMGQMPVGGADTGVAQAPATNDAGALALGGGLVLAALGGAFVVRRRATA